MTLLDRQPRSVAVGPCTPLLVVEDDHVLRMVLADLLGSCGYEVVTAAQGVEALELLAGGFKPHVIITDLMMPKMDGWALCSELRRDEELARIPVIVMSAGGRALLATAPPAEVYLAKPFRLQHLIEAVDRTCALDRRA